MYHPKRGSYKEVDRLGFAFKVNEEGEVEHIGFLYNGEAGEESNILHLAFHHDLRRHELKDGYFWIDADIEDERKGALSGAIHKIWLKNQHSKIAYGMKYSHENKYFGLDGSYLGPSFGPGLTCATFVLSALNDNGYPLVDFESWIVREDDEKFKEKILDALRGSLDKLIRKKSPTDQIENLERHIEVFMETEQCPRFRPGEIAAAGGQSNIPVKFVEAVSFAEKLIRSVSKV